MYVCMFECTFLAHNTPTFTRANHCTLLDIGDFYIHVHLTSYFVGYYTVGKLLHFLRLYSWYLFKIYVVSYNVINRNAILTRIYFKNIQIIEYLQLFQLYRLSILPTIHISEIRVLFLCENQILGISS